jgi:hypothetical protein
LEQQQSSAVPLLSTRRQFSLSSTYLLLKHLLSRIINLQNFVTYIDTHSLYTHPWNGSEIIGAHRQAHPAKTQVKLTGLQFPWANSQSFSAALAGCCELSRLPVHDIHHQ